MSISKLFLSIAVMQLWEQDKLELDADVSTYLPFEVRNPQYPADKITIRMLMNHTSGLAWPEDKDGVPEFYRFYPHGSEPLISEWLPEYILPGGLQYTPGVWKSFVPGSQERYSNIATPLLALIVETISGMEYRNYCQQHILQPLAMNNSAFRLSEIPGVHHATPFSDHGTPMQQYTYMHYPSGNLKSNVVDMSHFMTTILNRGVYQGKQILRESTFDEMLKIQNQASGMSLLWYHFLGGSFGHRGGGTGFSAMLEFFPNENKAMFIATNRYKDLVYPGGRLYELIRAKAFHL